MISELGDVIRYCIHTDTDTHTEDKLHVANRLNQYYRQGTVDNFKLSLYNLLPLTYTHTYTHTHTHTQSCPK